MRIATWNINSIRLRLDLVKKLAEESQADVLCLQEIKVEDALFPADALRQMGFSHLAFAGQKSYNGVAILSKIPLKDVHAENFLGRNDKRHIAATLPDGVRLHNVYVPAGGDIPDPVQNEKFDHKLRFLDAMCDYLGNKDLAHSKTIILGDFNIAPHEHDVWSHKQLRDVVSHTAVEIEKLAKLQATQNWLDLGRVGVTETQKIYSWWSYRNKDWEKSNRGRRLDHIWVTPALAAQCARIHHLRHVRNWERTSDHVPVMAEF